MKWKSKKWNVIQLNNRKDNIDLQPGFQRGAVWRPNKKQKFLDSVFQGWITPEFFLRSTEEKSKIYQCIDGQQRLRTIFEFLDNKISLLEETLGAKKNYSQLSPEEKDRMDLFSFNVIIISSATDAEVSEIFLRLNSGTVVNSAEKLKAIGGNIEKLVEKLSKHKFLSQKTVVRNTRDAYISIAAQTCLLEIQGIQDMKFKDLERFFRQNTSFNKRNKKIKKIKKVYDILNKVFDVKTKEIKNRASIISLYLLISKLLDKKAIKNKEKVIKEFFINFQYQLDKKIISDPLLLEYKNKIIQAQDSKKSVVVRDDILTFKLCEFHKEFYSFFPNAGDSAGALKKQKLSRRGTKDSIVKIGEEIVKLIEMINKKAKIDLFRHDNKRTALIFIGCNDYATCNQLAQALSRWINEIDKGLFLKRLQNKKPKRDKYKSTGVLDLIEILLSKKISKQPTATITQDFRDINLLAKSFARHGGSRLEKQRNKLIENMGFNSLDIDDYELFGMKILNLFLNGLQSLDKSKLLN